ncbi:MAG: uroporphyrinogen decarboxylase family protein [bacterium]
MDKIISVIKKQIKYAVFPIVCVDHCTHLTRTTFADVACDGEKIAQVLEYGYNLYEYDMVLLFVDAYVEAQALGCPVSFDPYATLVGPRSDQAFDRTGEVIKAAQLLKKKLKVPVFVSIKGPFTLASFLVGIQDFLKMVLKNPRDAEKNLEQVMTFQLEYLKRLLEVGVNIFIGDPVASASVISPEVFKDFAYRPLEILIKKIREKGAVSGIHICGDTAPLIHIIETLVPDILSIEDITLKTQIIKMGGVSTSTILNGEPSNIENEIKKAMAEPYLIVSTSCDVPVETNPGNIKHMIACAHEYSNN